MATDEPTTDGGVLLVLEEHLRRERERLAARRRELDDVGRLLASATSRSLGARDAATEPVPTAATAAVVNQLLGESRGMVRNFVLTVEQGPALDDATVRANRERMERGDPQRAVYPADVLSTPGGQQWLRVWAEAGEDQRILPSTATEFAVFGESAVVALGAWDDLSAGYVVVRDPLVVRLYTAYFDLAWRQAVPAPTRGEEREGDPRLVELLVLGRQGRGHRPAPRGEPADRAAPGRADHGGQRRRQPLPARLGARRPAPLSGRAPGAPPPGAVG